MDLLRKLSGYDEDIDGVISQDYAPNLYNEMSSLIDVDDGRDSQTFLQDNPPPRHLRSATHLRKRFGNSVYLMCIIAFAIVNVCGFLLAFGSSPSIFEEDAEEMDLSLLDLDGLEDAIGNKTFRGHTFWPSWPKWGRDKTERRSNKKNSSRGNDNDVTRGDNKSEIVDIPESRGFNPGPPNSVVLSKEDIRDLNKGLAVMKVVKKKGEKTGKGFAIQDVKAPVWLVWERILDFNSYVRMVDDMQQLDVYKVEEISRSELEAAPKPTVEYGAKGEEQVIYTRQKISVGFVNLQYHVRHVYWPKHSSLTWQLDRKFPNDFVESLGYWHVATHPDKKKAEEGWSRVYYSVIPTLPNWVPGFVTSFASGKGLVSATRWVKFESEKEANDMLQEGILDVRGRQFTEKKRQDKLDMHQQEEENRKKWDIFHSLISKDPLRFLTSNAGPLESFEDWKSNVINVLPWVKRDAEEIAEGEKGIKVV